MQRFFKVSDRAVVELAEVVGHIAGLSLFARTARIEAEAVRGPWQPLSAQEEPLLAEIESSLGFLPLCFGVMANSPEYLSAIWKRDQIAMADGDLDATSKLLAALGVAAAVGSDHLVDLCTRRAMGAGVDRESLFEVAWVANQFGVFNKFTEGLQLTPDLYSQPPDR